MNEPLVSIISPTFNQERYVARCVESALAQTYRHWEQVVVDDGSTDRTRDIVASYADPRVRLLSLPHRGLGALAESYNAALAQSRGSLVAVLEGDDAWPADKLARQVPLFRESRTTLSWGLGEQIDEDGRPAGTHASIGGEVPVVRLSASEAFKRLTRRNFIAPAATVVVRREALDRIGGFQQTGNALFVDFPTWLMVAATSDGDVVFMREVLGLYRLHAEQTSQRRRTQMMLEPLRVVRAVADAIGPDALARLGWDEHSRRRAESRGRLAEGETRLASGQYHEARLSFHEALRLAAGPPDQLLALLGLASAAMHVDLVSVALDLRARLAG